MSQRHPWHADLAAALACLGGKAELGEIYSTVTKIRRRHARIRGSWRACVRAQLERHSSDSARFAGRQDLFCAPNGIGSGVWALRSRRARRTIRQTARRKTA